MRTIDVAGFAVEVHTFGKRSFYYPSFNGNAEFPVTSAGFRRLSSYLRTVRWAGKLVQLATESMLKPNEQ